MNRFCRLASSSFPGRPPLQYRLRTLLFFVAGVALLLGLGVPYMRKAKERRLVATINESRDGHVSYDYEFENMDVAKHRQDGGHPSAPGWIRRIVGDDVFGHPLALTFFPTTPKEFLPTIGQLTSLTSVEFAGLEDTNGLFKAISPLSRLKKLEIRGPIDFHDLMWIPPMPCV